MPGSSGYYSIELLLAAYGHERIYGLGQHQTGAWDNKGQTFSLAPENTEVLIPVPTPANRCCLSVPVCLCLSLSVSLFLRD